MAHADVFRTLESMSFRPRLLLIAVVLLATAVVGARLLGGAAFGDSVFGDSVFGDSAFGLSSLRTTASIRPDLQHVSVFDPFGVPPLQGYGAFRDASASGDMAALQDIADVGNGYLAYEAALTVARRPEIDATTRLTYFRRAMGLRVDDSPGTSREHRLVVGAWRVG